MGNDRQTWTTGIFAQGEHMWYSYVVACDAINTWSHGFNKYSYFSLQRGCRHEPRTADCRNSGWHSMPYTSEVIDVVRSTWLRKILQSLLSKLPNHQTAEGRVTEGELRVYTGYEIGEIQTRSACKFLYLMWNKVFSIHYSWKYKLTKKWILIPMKQKNSKVLAGDFFFNKIFCFHLKLF